MSALPVELAEHLLFQGVYWLPWLVEAAGALAIALSGLEMRSVMVSCPRQ